MRSPSRHNAGGIPAERRIIQILEDESYETVRGESN
jgi:hypothetical protein